AEEGVHGKGASAGRPTKLGYANRDLSKSIDAELRRLNSKYGEAKDAWAGDSASAEALANGAEHFNRRDTIEQIQTEFNKLSPTEKDLYRVGAAQDIIEDMKKVTAKGNK